MGELVSVEKAAKMLGVKNVQEIRVHLQRGRGFWSKLGTAEKIGQKHYRYFISSDRVKKFKEQYL